MKTLAKTLIILIMLYFLGHEQYTKAILYGLTIIFLLTRHQEMNKRKPGKKYIN
jgi:hypothetical protein